MRIILSPRAEKILRKLPKIDQIAVAKKIRLIPEIKKQEERLKGFKNTYWVRVGEYRIVYRKSSKEIYIILIGHRKEIYDLLRQLFR